ncbi:MAG TPA: hypothetical protein GXZ47_07320 [Treponema sp.]|nr:hypothetical protein [Treponema sp.]
MKRLLLTLIACTFLLSFAVAEDSFLAGTVHGLYRFTNGKSRLVWQVPEVRKILHDGSRWIILTSTGIHASGDLKSFKPITEGLPVKILKIPENGTKRFVREVQELKDLEIHPTNSKIMVTATKDAVFLTKDGGASWKSLGRSAATTGIKAVSVLDLPDTTGELRLTVLMSHPIYGISWKRPDVSNPSWIDLNEGLYSVPSIRWSDEVADMIPVTINGKTDLYASNTFKPNIYRLDWEKKRFVSVWSGNAPLDTIDGLAAGSKTLVFSGPSRLREISYTAEQNGTEPVALNNWNNSLSQLPGIVLSAWIPARISENRGPLSLSELWLLSPNRQQAPYTTDANEKKGVYLPVHQVATQEGFARHLETMKKNNLNMLVVDMKDDYGYIRYDSEDPLVCKKGTKGRGITLEPFVKTAKENNIYLVARIVVFKDRQLSRYADGKYAVWDKKDKKPWQGYRLVAEQQEVSATEEKTEPTYVRNYYDEFWVDPYSEDVWEYTIAISKELIARGFDEIQFDYIRFPTDGKNLPDAQYRWEEAGMDKESALMSFLSYARSHINAPISIDIYGANGWYRTGARTGQDVELLARYVDVICPMFYPSHFEQQFLAHKPAVDRTYRIFFHGSYRNAIIARNHVIIRPWVQAFYLNVSYDRAYYNPDYVQRQIFGARDSINQGYTYWNNSGRYEDLRPDIDCTTPYPWDAPQEAPRGIIPFFREDAGALK